MRHVTRALLTVSCLAAPGGCSKSQPPLTGGRPIEHWIQASHDPDAGVRKQAITKLGNVGDADPAVWPALIVALKDKDPKVRCEAIVAIVKYGPAASEALEPLIAAQSNDPDAKVRDYAGRAVQKLAPARAP